MTVLRKPEHDSEPVRKVFSILVRSTLRYRDELYENEGAVLTVAHVRKCLDGLVPALATGNTPETGDLICQELLSRWIIELRVRPEV